jgi:hypothetical protein
LQKNEKSVVQTETGYSQVFTSNENLEKIVRQIMYLCPDFFTTLPSLHVNYFPHFDRNIFFKNGSAFIAGTVSFEASVLC